MPELPEVESLVAFLREHAVGAEVERVDVAAISVLKTFDPPVTALVGRRLADVHRRGKFLDLTCAGEQAALHLVLHLARAGWLRWRDPMPAAPARPGKSPLALRVLLRTGAGFELTEAGTQKRLAAYVVRNPDEVPGVAALGVEPLHPDFSVDALADLLAGNRSQIKGVLRDQKTLAGIGNAYSDDILHAARLSPFKTASSLSTGEVARLHAAIGAVLRDAVERSRGLGAGDLKAEKKLGMRVHGRSGQPCAVCGDTVREVSFADSSLQYCPTCQTEGRELADRRMSRLLK